MASPLSQPDPIPMPAAGSQGMVVVPPRELCHEDDKFREILGLADRTDLTGAELCMIGAVACRLISQARGLDSPLGRMANDWGPIFCQRTDSLPDEWCWGVFWKTN